MTFSSDSNGSTKTPNGSKLSNGTKITNGNNNTNGTHADDCYVKTATVPVAIIGMACRLPGEASSVSKLWDIFAEGKSTWKAGAPKDRFNWNAFHHPDPDFGGTFTVEGGHYNDYVNLKHFDSGFFGLPQAEAKILDPQQRLLLEVSYECLENGGIAMENIAGKPVGCFVAFSMGEYGRLWDKDLEYQPPFSAVASGEAMYANRISHVYDLSGPSISLDTGCSGSMVALELACQKLASGDIEASFVGGTNLTLIPDVIARRPRMLSKSGMCHTFDSAADGFSRADGTSVLYLKRLDDAIRDKDPIRAVIRAVATNSDGRTPGILMPSKDAQSANIRAAYAKAGLRNFSETGYFECHGTGTSTGDPIEVEAVGNVFSAFKSPEDPLIIGSCKTNMGHSEAASALTSIMKSVFTLETGLIAPTINIAILNPNIDFDGLNVKVAQQLIPLPQKAIARVSVNSFGYGGANGHAIIEASKHHTNSSAYTYSHGRLASQDNITESDYVSRPFLLLYSANDSDSFKGNVSILESHVSDPRSFINRLDLAYTLGARRSRLFHRGFSILKANSPIAHAISNEAVVTGKKEFAAPKVGVVFTGQGAQRPQMGKELIENFPSVADTLDRLDCYLNSLNNPPAWSLKDELLKPEKTSRINDPKFAQPLTVAIQIAVVNLLKLWGLTPLVTVGHSSGEIPAAYASGLISERSAIMIGYFRGFSITAEDDKISISPGGMLAVGLGKSAVLDYLLPYAGELVVACENSPESVTISGGAAEIQSLATDLAEAKVFARQLKVTKAYHNPNHMGVYASIFKNALDMAGTFDHQSKKGPTSMISTVHGKKLGHDEVQNAEYWRQNMEFPVLFSKAMNVMLDLPEEERVQVILEIGPSSTLKGPIRQILKASKLAPGNLPKYVPTLIGGSNSSEDILAAVGTLVTIGYPMDVEKVNALETFDKQGNVVHIPGKLIVDLPNYSWNHSKEMWHEPQASKNHRFRQFRRHEILGSRLSNDNPLAPTWRNLLRYTNTKWLQHHKLHDDIVFPAAGYIAMAAEAIRQLTKDSYPAVKIRNLSVRSALVLNDSPEGVDTFLTMSQVDSTSKWFHFTICSQRNDETDVHCSGQITATEEDHFGENTQRKWTKTTSGRQWYKKFANAGFNYTETFQVIEHIQSKERQQTVQSTIKLPDTSTLASHYLITPAVIDGCMQTLLASAVYGKPGALQNLYVPSMFDEIYLTYPEPNSGTLDCLAFIDEKDVDSTKSGLVGYVETRDKSGRVVLSMSRLACTLIESGDSRSLVGATQPHKVTWKPDVSFLDTNSLRNLVSSTKVAPDDWKSVVRLMDAFSVCAAEKTGSLRGLGKEYLRNYSVSLENMVSRLVAENNKSVMGLLAVPMAEREQQLLDDFYSLQHVSDVKMLQRLYENLDLIYKGDVDSLEVMMQDELLKDFYKTGMGFPEAGQALTLISDLICHQDPTLDFLEIGGGTGGATADIFKALGSAVGSIRRFGTYTFTDISGGFFPKAKTMLGPNPRILYKTLDIETNPLDQGYQEGSYDVIFAANVLHATCDMVYTLKNVRKLLKNGGRLVLLEATGEARNLQLIMGTLSGWWLSKDGRKESPLLSVPKWNSLLASTGFSGVDIHLDDFQSDAHCYSIMVSTATQIGEHEPLRRTNINPNEFVEKDKFSSTLQFSLDYQNNGDRLVGNLLKEFVYEDDRSVIVFIALANPDVLAEMSDGTLAFLKDLSKVTKPIIWLSRGGEMASATPSSAMIVGLARVLAKEEPDLCLVNIDFDSITTINGIQDIISRVLHKTLQGSPEREYAVRNGVVYINRLLPDAEVLNSLHNTGTAHLTISSSTPQEESPLFEVDIMQPGLLQTLKFLEVDGSGRELEDHEVDIEMKAVGLNFKDVAIAMGLMPHKYIGLELSGVVVKTGSAVTAFKVGDRVAALNTKEGAFRSHVRAHDYLCLALPDGMSFIDGATIPVVFFTNILAMIQLGKLKKGQTILVHSAAGGIGICAIQLAHYIGAEVFATVGSEEKRRFLVEQMNIQPSRIFNSRNAGFQRQIMLATANRGVDVVLNSLSGDLLAESWYCVAESGCMLELGKIDFNKRHVLQMRTFAKSASFHGIDASVVMRDPPMATEIMTIMRDLLQQRAIKPISPIHLFSLDEFENAFRFMQNGRSHGKIVISREIAVSKEVLIQRYPSTLKLPSNASYLLIGCLGGLGRSIANFLFKKGARSFIFLSPSGDEKTEAKALVQELRDSGSEVIVTKGDVASMQDVMRAITAAPDDKPIAGMIHAAMVLNDALFSSLSGPDYKRTVDPKVKGAFNLHSASLSLDKPLDFFIMLSSVSGVMGQHGQSNYAAANAYLDALAANRLSNGLAASSIDLGSVEDVGWTSEQQMLDEKLESLGILSTRVKEAELLRLIELQILNPKHQQLEANSLENLNFECSGQIVFGLAAVGSKPARAFSAPRFRALLNMDDGGIEHNESSSLSKADSAVIELLKSSNVSVEKLLTPTLSAIKQKIAEFLLLPVEDIDSLRSPESLGIDSLVTVELRTWFKDSFGTNVTTLEILKAKSFGSLSQLVAERMVERLDTAYAEHR